MAYDNESIKQELYARAGSYLTPDNASSTTGRVTGWLCPSCPSGTGKTGTGLKRDKDGVHYKCFACGFYGDIVDIIAAEQHLENAPYPEKLKAACGALGVPYEGKTITTPKKPTPSVGEQKSREQQPKPNKPAVDYTEFFKQCAACIEQTSYHRGISLETLKAYGIGFAKGWKNPANSYDPPSDRLIFPTSKNTYFARLAKEGAEKKDKLNVGPAHLFNDKALDLEGPVHIVEGALDALSVIDVGGQAIGLNSAGNYKLLFEKLKERKEKGEGIPKLILSFDDDDTGRQDAGKLTALLDSESIPYRVVDLGCGLKDPNEALMKKKDAFQEKVLSVFEEYEQEKMAERYAKWESLQTENASQNVDLFMEHVQSQKTNFIPTGFAELDKLLDGGLYPGLYFLGAMTSLGKTTFCIQLADMLSESGHEVLFFSLEMARFELMARSMSRLSYAESVKRCGTKDLAKTTHGVLLGKFTYQKEKEVMAAVCEQYRRISERLYITEGVGDIGVKDIRNKLEQFKEATGGRVPKVIFVDYLQVLAPADVKASDKQNTDKAVLELKRISRDYNITVFGISSFNRENYTEPVNPASFKESGSIEYGTDILIGLQYAKMEFDKEKDVKKDERIKRVRRDLEEITEKVKRGEEVEVQVKILKNRNGKKGSVVLNMRPMFNAFTEPAAVKEEVAEGEISESMWDEALKNNTPASTQNSLLTDPEPF